MKLVILESGAKARTIKKYLGKGWIVDACNGHVQDLPSNRKNKDSSKAMWSSKPGELPKPPWSWTDRAERIMTKIISKAEKAGVDEVLLLLIQIGRVSLLLGGLIRYYRILFL